MRSGGRSRRIGVLGGTLDPIHVGHVEAARAATAALSLSSLVILPSRVPPHRQHGPSASPFHRFAMAALALSGLPYATVSDEELCTEGPSYTVLTLERFADRWGEGSQIFFITGADAFAEIETWYRYPAVLDLAHFAVVSRPGTPVRSLGERLPTLTSRFRDPRDRDDPSGRRWIYPIDAPTPDVSSTEIRRRLRDGESIQGMVPAEVELHIRRHGLYLETTTADHLQ